MRCPACGRPTRPSDRFCRSCGTALETTAETTPEPIRFDPVAGHFHPAITALEVVSGSLAGTVFALDRPVTRIGRDPENDLFLDDVTVSRRHAEIRRLDDGSFVLEDLGSLNGTYLDGLRITGATVLRHLGRLRIGRYAIIFHRPDAAT